jgi:hypothetical protein
MIGFLKEANPTILSYKSKFRQKKAISYPKLNSNARIVFLNLFPIFIKRTFGINARHSELVSESIF